MIYYPIIEWFITLKEFLLLSEESLANKQRWEWASYLDEIEEENGKEKIKELNFSALSLDEMTTIDYTS